MSILRIALVQTNPTVGDLAGNAAGMVAGMERAREAGADVVAFPELALSGYPPEDLLLRPQFLGDCRAALEGVSRRSEGLVVVAGFPDADGQGVYNAASLIREGRPDSIYHKVELPNYGVFDEKRYFSPGSGPLVFTVKETRIAVTICEDAWIEGGPVEQEVRESGAEVVLNLSASPFHAGKLALRREVLAGFARRTGTFVCHCNLVGGQDELVFDGGSMVLDPRGEVIASAGRFEEALLVADIDAGAGKAVAGPRAAELDPREEVYRALVLATGDYVRKNGFETVVVGLSGGLDSSLTAAVAVDALGRENVVGVTMPSQYTSRETRSDAELLALRLGIRLISVPIRPVFAAHLDALAEPFGNGRPGIEMENLQARIRGNILMALSNRFGWLVLNTGNKSEFAVGYCTLYGDMVGAFAVIKDVPKTLAYELSAYVNQKAGRDLIPKSVLERPPSAELKPDQKDEDTLPPYEVLDPILRAYVEEDRTPDDIVKNGADAEIVRQVVRMVDRSEYKRRQAPPGAKITPKAFGRDRRLPITNRYSPGDLEKP